MSFFAFDGVVEKGDFGSNGVVEKGDFGSKAVGGRELGCMFSVSMVLGKAC